MAIQFDFPTASLEERNARSYWTAVYSYLSESALNRIFDFSALTVDTETYTNTGFTMSYKPGTPLYGIGNTSPDTFTFSGNGTDGIKISQSISLGSYAAHTYTVSTTNSFEKDVGFKAAETTGIIYFLVSHIGAIGSDRAPAWWFDKSGTGCLFFHSSYTKPFIYSAGNGQLRVNTSMTESYGCLTTGLSYRYYLKPLAYGDAIFDGIYIIDGGASSQYSVFKGEFTFNGSVFHCIGDWGSSALCFKVR